MYTLRVEYAVKGEAAFLSHLEFMKTVERAVRRADLPLAFSEGFNPHPKIAIAAPLPVGVGGTHEYLDIELTEKVPQGEFVSKLNKEMPNGITILRAKAVGRVKPLMAVINAASYYVELDAEVVDRLALKRGIEAFLNETSVVVERKTQKGTKQIDVRKGVYELKTVFSVLNYQFEMLLAMGNSGNIRPQEVITAILKSVIKSEELTGNAIAFIERTGLFLYRDGQKLSPMNLGSEEVV